MSPDRQRIVIAEARGWIYSPVSGKWCHPDNWRMAKNGAYEVWVGRDGLPNYLCDLNAMHEVLVFLFEKGINCINSGQALSAYALELGDIISRDHRGESSHRKLIATAAQCAEAFIKATRRWED